MTTTMNDTGVNIEVNSKHHRLQRLTILGLLLSLAIFSPSKSEEKSTLLNVSYDIARELYADINAAFVPYYLAKTGKTVEIKQSHAGSSKQARAIIQGLPADIVTFNQVLDVDALVNQGGFVRDDWQSQYPNNGSPYYSLPAFLVRKDNPKNIQDWGDLAREEVSVVMPNPKTSGNGRYSFLAAQAWAQEKWAGDAEKISDFNQKFLAHVKVFDTGGRSASMTFTERKIGDVLLTFEAEIKQVIAKYPGEFELVVPSVSLLAEFPVAVIDKNVDKNQTRALAQDYAAFLYTTEAQEIIAKHFNRTTDAKVTAKYAEQYPAVKLVRVEDVFSSWKSANTLYFGGGGVFDKALKN